MKIALVSTHATSEGGGPNYVASLARVLAKGHEVAIYMSRFESFDGIGVRHRKIRTIGSGGLRSVHINSTAMGGGLAEVLR